MKTLGYLSLLAIVPASILISSAQAGSFSVNTPGAGSWAVPAGVTSVTIVTTGGGGGGASQFGRYRGGHGAVVTRVLTTSGGETLSYFVGGGGGIGGNPGAGGGSTNITGTVLGNPLLIIAGGGGGGGTGNGGIGGAGGDGACSNTSAGCNGGGNGGFGGNGGIGGGVTVLGLGTDGQPGGNGEGGRGGDGFWAAVGGLGTGNGVGGNGFSTGGGGGGGYGGGGGGTDPGNFGGGGGGAGGSTGGDTYAPGTNGGAGGQSGGNGSIVFTWSENSVCGSANGVATAFEPATNLCAVGTPSAVGGAGNWAWTCDGGVQASCTAPYQDTATGSGSGKADISGGAWAVDTAQSAGFIATSGDPSGKSPPSMLSGYTFPHGLFDFVLTGGVAGTTATITITYPTALPANAVYWKYGPSPDGYNCSGVACASAHWYQMPPAQAVFSGNTVTLAITDGGVGDDDLQANGVIVDQGGPGVPGAGGASPIPTLSEWGMILLSSLLAIGTVVTLRHRRI